MDVKVDFRLRRNFETVEHIIFRLVLHGYTDIGEIRDALPLFSSPVIANAIRHLVNSQVLAADLSTGKLNITEPLIALIEMSHSNPITLDIPENVRPRFNDGGLSLEAPIGSEDQELAQKSEAVKAALLDELFPEVNLALYRDSMDFVLKQWEAGE